MFVYHINYYKKIPLYYLLLRKIFLRNYIKVLKNSINRKFNLKFRLLCTPGNEIILADIYFEKDSGDWIPELTFYLCESNNFIVLKYLTLPIKLRNNGIGTFIVEQMKKLCKTFGYNFIILGSYEHAYGFWKRMNFNEISSEETDELLGY